MRSMATLKLSSWPCTRTLPPPFSVLIRILWHYTHPAPALPNRMPPSMKILAHLGHFTLYIMLLTCPISRCLLSWSAGRPVPVSYLFEIPGLLQNNLELLAITKPVHIDLSWFAGILVIDHIAAALKHHFIDQDHLLRSMTRQAQSSVWLP